MSRSPRSVAPQVATPEDADPTIPAKEAARIRHRDRKRDTRMVVDGAGIKRVQRAIADKRRADTDTAPEREGP